MNIDKVSLGNNPPYEFNMIVEIPQGGVPVKYEMDKESGAMFVDRFLNTSMTYPANYGFIPHTLASDGDPCDVLVLASCPVIPGAIIRVRPIGALIMTDEAGLDDKIIAVPIDSLNPYYGWVKSPADLPQVLLDQVAHFFQHYKDLEEGKWVAGLRWVGYEEALALVAEGIKMGSKATTSPAKISAAKASTSSATAPAKASTSSATAPAKASTSSAKAPAKASVPSPKTPAKTVRQVKKK